MESYEILNMGIVNIDAGATVKDLVMAAYKKFHKKNPIDFRYITVFDVKTHKIILDNNIQCSRVRLGEKLCIAYYVPNKWYYVEGNWGQHMIEMNASKFIPSPISFKLIIHYFSSCGNRCAFSGWPVINGNIRLKKAFKFLTRLGLAPNISTSFHVKDYRNGEVSGNFYYLEKHGNIMLKRLQMDNNHVYLRSITEERLKKYRSFKRWQRKSNFR